MRQSGDFSRRLGDFFAGKGFYIVLILCVAIIGASAWAMLTNNRADLGIEIPVFGEINPAPDLPPGIPTIGGAQTPSPSPTPDDEDAFFFRDEEDDEDEQEQTPTDPPPETDHPTVVEPEQLQFVWPVSGAVELTHSLDRLIFDHTMGDWRTHAGIDIAANLGEPVIAIAAGVVERIFTDDLLGRVVLINHGNGLRSLYANLMENPVVEEGKWINMGTPIGAVGNTALAKSGSVHLLHLEMFQDGEQIDPLLFLPER